MWHMFFCSVLAFCLVRSGYVAPVEGVTMEVYMRAIVPIGLLFSVVLWTGNTAYMYLSVSFIQMLKVRMHWVAKVVARSIFVTIPLV